MHLHENTLIDLDIGVQVTQDVVKYPLHHVAFSDTKFEVARSDGLRGDAFRIGYLPVNLDFWVKLQRNFYQ